MGREFADDALTIDAERDGVRLLGFAGLPTASRSTRALPAPVRQPAAGPGPPAEGRAARRLRRPAVPRPPADGGAVPRARARARSTSTSIRPRPRSAFASPGVVRGLVIGALRQALLGGRRPDREHARRGALGAFRPGGPAAGRARRGARAWPRPRSRYQAPTRRRAASSSGRRRRATTGAAPPDDAPSSAIRSARRGPSCTTPTSWPRPATAWSWSTSTPPTSGWSTSA